MKARLYLESTIPSYLTAKPSRDLIVAGHQQLTQDWWTTRRSEFDLFVSQLVLDEESVGDPEYAAKRLDIVQSLPLLDLTEAVTDLAAAILQSGTIPTKAARDAAHVAASAVHGMDYLLTWNCAHIANARIVRRLQRVCQERGLTCPVICTPEVLMGDVP
jgi:hypothetical protein